ATFLTAMVVAREWERGTMEQLLTTPVTRGEFIISKLLPYWVLGMGALSVCILCTRCLFGVPMRAPLWAVAGVGGLFLLSVLSMGLLISTLVRNQYTASLLAMVASILPTMLLSGLIFEISSMPAVIRAISYFIPARYLLRAYTTLFLAGPMWQVLLHQILFLAVSALFWCSLVPLVTPKRLD
ncbi:MAG: ABC transporter permease, partial [Akkermansia sp.]